MNWNLRRVQFCVSPLDGDAELILVNVERPALSKDTVLLGQMIFIICPFFVMTSTDLIILSTALIVSDLTGETQSGVCVFKDPVKTGEKSKIICSNKRCICLMGNPQCLSSVSSHLLHLLSGVLFTYGCTFSFTVLLLVSRKCLCYFISKFTVFIWRKVLKEGTRY